MIERCAREIFFGATAVGSSIKKKCGGKSASDFPPFFLFCQILRRVFPFFPLLPALPEFTASTLSGLLAGVVTSDMLVEPGGIFSFFFLLSPSSSGAGCTEV